MLGIKVNKDKLTATFQIYIIFKSYLDKFL